jgi:hypothetical protein
MDRNAVQYASVAPRYQGSGRGFVGTSSGTPLMGPVSLWRFFEWVTTNRCDVG